MRDPHAQLQYWCVSLSGTHCRIWQILFYIPVWWEILWLRSLPALFSTSCHNLYFLWYTSKHSPIHSPTSHSLHFTCTLFRIPCVEQVQQFTLEEWIGQWLLKFTWSQVTVFSTAAGLPMGQCRQGKLPVFSIKFCTRARRKFPCVVLAPHNVKRRKLFMIVMS
jgi:hypothetical protein